ncbi:uncharacterized protein F5147DRAFT_652725 [Suillus discolor]|uniref:Uncharacterized protein n=1 Tax=Suillus discolor TaxID=1912936 RepID=A0A9P7F8K4_9AGAM|nr:uncharacterized protein F5147DRAFT_652725 [Suillus discolor]KAG2108737.1 hypothetical protein F5147DRAFT_652725 [Suillus discolor]
MKSAWHTLSSRTKPSACALRGNLQAYEMQELQWGINALLMTYERELQRSSDNDVYMGSAVDLDLPISAGNRTNGTYGCTDVLMAYDEVGPLAIVLVPFHSSYQMPKKINLIRGLHKGMNKYIERHCKRMHPVTERLWERMYIVLQTAMLGIDVDDIVLPEACYNGELTTEVENQNVTQIIHSTPINDYLISPAIARQIFDQVENLIPKVKRGLQSLGAALSTKPSAPMGGRLTGYPATMPGEFAES